MKALVVLGTFVVLAAGTALAGAPAAPHAADAAATACKWSNPAALKTHVTAHAHYPTTGKAIKEACKKEAPAEFTAADRACLESHLKDDASFKDAAEVLKALGV